MERNLCISVNYCNLIKMNRTVSSVKSFVFTTHVLLMMCGLGAVAVHVYGLENAKSNSNEHTFYIVGIILSLFVSLVTIFGCYGALAESIAVNILYAFLLLIVLLLQAQQMRGYQPEIFRSEAELHLNRAWHVVPDQPNLMQSLEKGYRCCALYGHGDYETLNMTVPVHCYQNISDKYYPTRGCVEALQISYLNALRRESLSNWCLIGVEIFSYLLTVIYCTLLFKRPHQEQLLYAPVHLRTVPPLNHVNSRTHLLSS